jgi:UDP-glucose 4-epimerase
MPERILVTGGAGFIGSHCCLLLLEAGHEVTVVDNLQNSSQESLRRVEQLSGRKLEFHRVDLLDANALDEVFRTATPQAVIHFAGLKAVGESVQEPLRYFHNNVIGTLHLLEAMRSHDVRDLIFSSSATVYGDPETVPIREDAPLAATNPYGRTKLMIEDILRDLAVSEDGWHIALLRYFNPIGAHESGTIGEDPQGPPNNLMPYVMQVAVGRREGVAVFGDDYDTADGTGIRDYIHVVDLVEGHLAALRNVSSIAGCEAFNLGAGAGTSVFELLAASERAVGHAIPHEVVGRRPGDIATCYADATKASERLGWKARRGIEQMCEDHWRWQSNNPQGYAEETEFSGSVTRSED